MIEAISTKRLPQIYINHFLSKLTQRARSTANPVIKKTAQS
jgi:hypothetical protein